MDFKIRIGLGKHVAEIERKNEVVQVPMIVELTLIVIKTGIRALRISVQNLAHPLWIRRSMIAKAQVLCETAKRLRLFLVFIAYREVFTCSST